MSVAVVFLAEHVRDEGNEDEDVKTIGIYSSENLAEQAIEALKMQPGFSNYPDGFIVSKVELDYTAWIDGFII